MPRRTKSRRDYCCRPAGLRKRIRQLELVARDRDRLLWELKEIAECVGNLTLEPAVNIGRFTALCGKIVGASFAEYDRLRHGSWECVTTWNAPPDYDHEASVEKSLASEVLHGGDDPIRLIRDLEESRYAASDRRVARHGLKTFLGYGVRVYGNLTGALCLFFTRDFALAEHTGLQLLCMASSIRLSEEHQLAIEQLLRTQIDLEQRVEQRTQELLKANLSLRAEIAEKERIAADLRQRENQFRQLLENASDIFCLTDSKGVIIQVNPVAARLTGYSEQELLRKNCLEFIHPDDREAASQFYITQFKERILDTYSEFRIVNRRGETVWLGQNVQLIMEGKTITGFQAICRDITERRRAESELKKSQEQFRAQYKAIPIPTYTWKMVGEDLVLVDCNDAAYEISQGGVEKFLGTTARELLHDREEIVDDLYRCYREKTTIFREMEIQLKSTGEWKCAAVKYAYVAPDLVLVHGEDVTESRRTEQALRESEARYRGVVEDQTELICRYRPDFTMTFINEAFCRFFCMRQADLIGRSLIWLMPEQGGMILKNSLKAISRDNPLVSIEQLCTVGVEPRWLQWTIRAILDQGGQIIEFQSVGRDVTERRRAEESLARAYEELELRVVSRTAALSKTNELLRQEILDREAAEEALKLSKETVEALLNATADLAFLLDSKWKFRALNKASEKFLGIKSEDAVGTSLFQYIPPGVGRRIRPILSETMKKRVTARFGETLNDRIMAVSAHPVLVPDRKVDGIAIFMRDCTDYKRLQEFQAKASKLEAMRNLAAGTAHAIRNPLAIASSAAQLLAEAGVAEDFRESCATKIVSCIDRASAIIDSLLYFARPADHEDGPRDKPPPPKAVALDLSDIVNNAIEMSEVWWRSIPEKLKHSPEMIPTLRKGCFVIGQAHELFEVVINLLKNALEAVGDNGEVRVETFMKKGEVVLMVRDDGVGIPGENASRLFEPFFTTKGYANTGLGLATCYGIVSRHGGTISVESTEGQGATFTVRLPAAQSAADPKALERYN